METEDSVEDDGNEFVAQADKLASMIVRIRIWNLFISLLQHHILGISLDNFKHSRFFDFDYWERSESLIDHYWWRERIHM